MTGLLSMTAAVGAIVERHEAAYGDEHYGDEHDEGCPLCEEVTPTCDYCGRAGESDWNGETGCHLTCEEDAAKA